MTTESELDDKEWWDEYYRQERQDCLAFIKKHSELKVGQVVNALLKSPSYRNFHNLKTHYFMTLAASDFIVNIRGRKKYKTKVIIKHTPMTTMRNDKMFDWDIPLYWVQRLKGNPHMEPVRREEIIW